jgi:expansin (peptidoglycan-binding protein)
MGACGEYEADDSYVVALNSVQYGDMTKKSSWCGKTVRVHYGGKSVEAVINDACPECRYGSIDLTPPVFNTLGDPDVGILQVKWEVV